MALPHIAELLGTHIRCHQTTLRMLFELWDGLRVTNVVAIHDIADMQEYNIHAGLLISLSDRRVLCKFLPSGTEYSYNRSKTSSRFNQDELFFWQMDLRDPSAALLCIRNYLQNVYN